MFNMIYPDAPVDGELLQAKNYIHVLYAQNVIIFRNFGHFHNPWLQIIKRSLVIFFKLPSSQLACFLGKAESCRFSAS